VEIVWYTAMSMDGRIAGADHSLEFLDVVPGPGANDFDEFIAGIDGVLVGAETLRWLVRHGHGWPHDDLPTWLVSHDEALAESVRPTRAPLVRVAGSLTGAIEMVERGGRRRVWLAGGGSVAAQVLELDRLDEVIATIAPTALGSGPALFDGPRLPRRMFELIECRSVGSWARLRWTRRPEGPPTYRPTDDYRGPAQSRQHE
jgi:riboflavin biosynthesis pyrimidine reductase